MMRDNEIGPRIIEFRKLAKRIYEWNLSELTRGGLEFNFVDLESLLLRTKNFFGWAAVPSYEFISEDATLQLLGGAQEVHNAMSAMAQFNPKNSPEDPRNAYQQIKVRLNHALNEAYQKISPHALTAHALNPDSTADLPAFLDRLEDRFNKEADARFVEAMKKMEVAMGVSTRMVELEAQAKEALLAAQKAAETSGIVREATHFETAAKEHRSAAIWWLVATVLLVGGVALGAYEMLENHSIPPTATPAVISHYVITRIALLGLGYFGITWCARNYSAARHNYVVNKHRCNALSTFQAFSSGAGDVATKNAILLQATTSIFSPQISGYVRDEPSPTDSAKIVEVFRGAVGKPDA